MLTSKVAGEAAYDLQANKFNYPPHFHQHQSAHHEDQGEISFATHALINVFFVINESLI